jgi:hypothetical protein
MRWRWWSATKPLARLAIDDSGIEAGPRGPSVFGRLKVSWAWADIKAVQPVRGLIPWPDNVGVAFYGDTRLVFWSSSEDRDRIIDDVQRLAPPTLAVSTQPKFVL